MRADDGQMLREREPVVGRLDAVRTRRPRQLIAIPRETAQHAVDKGRRARDAGSLDDLDAVVHRRAHRDARKVEQLVGGQAEGLEHGRIQLRERPSASLRQLIVERVPPAQRPGDELGSKRAVALIGERVAGPMQRFAEIELLVFERPEHAECGCARWPDSPAGPAHPNRCPTSPP